MSIYYKVRSVQGVFNDLDKKIVRLKHNSGINCIAGCGACCLKPDIEANVLEFLPLAYNLFKNNQTNQLYDLLESRKNEPTCVFFRPLQSHGKGFCGNYQYRGLICRLFGFSATKNKYGEKVMATCKSIKELYADKVAQISSDSSQKKHLPVISDFYQRLSCVDHHLANMYLPINEAMKKAIEIVSMHYFYRKPRAS